MATKDGTIKAIELLRDPFDGGTDYTAIVSATFPAYTSATDTAQIGGSATAQLYGAANDTLATLIQKTRKDGKTVTVRSATRDQPGSQGGVAAYAGGACTVTGGNVTFNLSDVAGTDTTFAAGVSDVPVRVAVHYSVA